MYLVSRQLILWFHSFSDGEFYPKMNHTRTDLDDLDNEIWDFELMILRWILDFELILECLRHLRMLGIRWIYFAYGEGREFGDRAEGRLLRVELFPPLKCAEVLFPGPQDGIYLEIGLLQEA